jgi:histidinol-phosphate aminotransferase
MSKYWNSLVREIKPYIPGEQPKDKKYIKLNTNESPYPPSPKVLAAIQNAASADLRLYPDPESDTLRQTISDYYGLQKERIFVGNGSDEVLAFAFMAFFDPERTILFPDITYTFYPVYADLFRLNYQTIPLLDDFTLQVDPFLRPNGGVIIPNPNAPTAIYSPVEEVLRIVSHNTDSVVIIDEAYVDFGGESMIPYISEYPNLLVVQTLSKSRALAGLRVGLACGHEDLIQGLNRIKNSINSYTMDRLALAGANAAFIDEPYFQQICRSISSTRKWVSAELSSLGFVVPESLANFVFISHPKCPAITIFEELKQRSILVRYFNLPRINNYLRVSIGTDDEMRQLVQVLKEIIAGLQ